MAARNDSARLKVMRCRTRIRPGLLVPALILTVLSPLRGASPDPFDTHRVLGDDGSIFEWSSGGSLLRRATSPLGFADLGGAVKDLASFAGGTRLIVLLPNRDDPGKGRKRREGMAMVYDTSSPIPTLMQRIPFAGDGYGMAMAPDGSRCYVLAARPEGGRGGPRFWIHGLDPAAGEVTSATLLEKPGTGLAVSPDGDRLFVSFENRIQSYTTRPLLTSWHYRSPGINGGLYFPPESDVLYAIRTGGIALFDPAIILQRDRNAPRDETDDSTGSIPLPFGPAAMMFSTERPRAAALGNNAVVFVDLATGAALPSPEQPAVLREAALLRPLEFLPGGDLVVGLFPAGIVTAVDAPETPAPLPATTAQNDGTDAPAETAAIAPAAIGAMAAAAGSGATATPADSPAAPGSESAPPAGPPGVSGPDTAPQAEPEAAFNMMEASPVGDRPAQLEPPATDEPVIPVVANPPADDPEPEAAPETAPEPAPPRTAELFLSGRLSGEPDLVAALVLYGPGSIIREHSRVTPAADGRFRLPLPAAGTYRLVPIGGTATPIVAQPNFHTITVEAGTGRADLDFSIENGP